MSIHTAMEKRYPSPEFALLWEVGNATGGRHRRSADAMVMGLWPSRGLLLEGFEIKTYRSDWLRELKDPAKADEIAKHCDRWWLVAGDEKVAKLDELPENWGLLVLSEKGDKLRVAKEAPRFENPEPLGRAQLAAILRRAHEALHEQIQAAERRGKSGAEEERREKAEELVRLHGIERSHDALKEAIEAFEQASGIRITAYDGRYLGESFKTIHRIRNLERDPSDELMQAAAQLRSKADELTDKASIIRAARSEGEQSGMRPGIEGPRV